MELKKSLIVCGIILLATLVVADYNIFVPVNYNNQSLYNISQINSTLYCDDTGCYNLTFLSIDTTYSHLTNFTDDLGNRGYTNLFNFTNGPGYYNSTDFSISDYFTKTQIENFNYWNDTFATFNKTYADTLYAGIEWDYNQTTPAIAYADATFLTTETDPIFTAWDNFTGIPTATPSNGDTTHLSTADQIYDYIVSLNYVANAITSLLSDTSPQLGGYLDANGQNIGSTTDEIENIYVGDNTRIYFGDGQDASIYYNTTHLVIG